MHTRNAHMTALLLCLALILSTMSGCQSASSPADTLARFQDAYNRLDLNTALDCFQPAQSQAMRSMVNIAVGLTGIGVSGEDLINILPLFTGLQGVGSQGAGQSGVMPQIAIQPGAMRINNTSASCPYRMVLTFGGESQTFSGTCTFILEQGQWYIQYMQ